MPKILAIDDINDNLISLKAIIDDAFPGSVVLTALNGSKGIELAIANNPDVILLDIIMPDMDGFEVCQKLKQDERVSDIPVVFLTALKGDKENRIKALEVGAEGFLSKPIDETELIAQIRAMVKIKAANEQKYDEKEKLQQLVEERTNLLQQSQAQLKGIFENLQDAYFQADLSGKFTMVSPSALKMYGYRSVDELLGQPAEILYFDTKERYSLITILRTEGQIKDYVSHGRKKDGSAFWVSMNIQWLWSKDRQIIGTEGVVRDITERINTERALRESEERFRHISSSISDISYSCETDLNGNSTINWLYGAVEEITGYTIEEILATKCWGKLVLDEDFPIFKSCILGVVPGQSKACQLRLKKKDGNVVWIQATSECVKGKNDKGLNTIYGGLVDISDRKLAEQALQKSEAQFREFFEKASDAIFIAEVESGMIVDANEAASRLMLRPHNELVGIHQTELHPPVRKSYVKNIFEKYTEHLKNKETASAFENSVIRADGIEVPVEIMASEVEYHGKHCLMGTFRDITERRRTEKALRESEYFFRESQRAAFVGSYKLDINNDCWSSSEVLDQIFGIDENHDRNAIGWLEITHPEDREMIESYLREEILVKRNDFNKEYRIIRKSDGETRWVLGLGKLDFDEQDNVVSMIGTIQDITKRKGVENALRRSNTRFELAMEAANMSWWEMDLVSGNVVFEKRKAEMLGFPPEKFKHYTDFMALVHPEDSERTMNAMRAHITGAAEKYEAEYRIKNQAGEYKWFYDIGSIVKRDNDDKPLVITGLVLNISERKQAEDALREREQLFRGLFNASPDAIVLIDPLQSDVLWPIVDCNEAACIMNGYSREEMIGQSIDLLNGTLGTLEDRVLYYDTMKQKGIIHEEIFHVHKDGHLFPIETASSIININGHEMVLGIDRDITERKLAEQKLNTALLKAQESDRLKSSFLANMSHEIRTPLNSIIGFSELMTDPNFDADQQSEFARIIINSGNSLLSIISDIMDFSKIEVGQVIINKFPFVTQKLLSELQKEYSIVAQGKGIELRIDPLNPVEDIWITSDENRLRQVLINLVGNAIKFTKKGHVEIGIKTNGDSVQFHVSDSGIGIPEEYHNEIFERFRQVESADTRKYGGNGLGLAISKSLVEIMGGEIWMESVQGNGSTFYFTIPK